jgi:ABC-2 type transport system permease protein
MASRAARSTADGASFGAISGLLERELGIGVLYAMIALLLLHILERESRRHATLERI